MKRYDKGDSLLSDEEIQRARSGRVLSTAASVPVELECITLPLWTRSPTWKLSEPHTIGMFMGASLCRYDWSLTPFLALVSSQENGGERLIIPNSWSWLGLSRGQPSSRSDQEWPSHFLRTKTLLSPRKLPGCQEPCVRSQGQRPIYILSIISQT